jgi:serine/threonine kinase PknH
MTDEPQGPGWWQASDLKWYPPERHPNYEAPPPSPPPKLPPPSSWAPPQQPPQPAPARRSATPWILAGVVAAVVVVLVVAGIAGYLVWPRPHTSPTPTAQPPTAQPSTTSRTVAPVAEAALDGLLLSPDQINTAMGATGMTVTGPNSPTATWDDSDVADTACKPLVGAAEGTAYAGSGWSALLGQELHPPGDDRTHYVVQVVVLFSSAQAADAFFTASAQRWPACANRQYTETVAGKPDEVWTVGPVSNTNGTLSATQTTGGGDSYWHWDSCQRALTVANNVVIDVKACSQNQSDSQSDSGVNIANQIAGKVPT